MNTLNSEHALLDGCSQDHDIDNSLNSNSNKWLKEAAHGMQAFSESKQIVKQTLNGV